jgi:pimeloyl-ACP methyl ester carboxylesterase
MQTKLLAALAAAPFGLAAAWIGANWAPDRSASSLKLRWAPAPSEFVAIGGLPVHMRDEGPRDDPHPIVLLHGTGASLHTWEGWVAILKGQHRVISLDLPGFGLTGPFPSDDYRMENYTRFMGDFLGQLGVKDAVLAGNSFGGLIAWQTALARPDLVSRLALIDSRGYPIDMASLPLGLRIAQFPILRPLINHILPRSFIEKGLIHVYGDPGKVTPDLAGRYYELTLRAGNRRALAFIQREVMSCSDSDRIKTIAIPALILWGRLDRQISLSDAERFHRDIAGSQLTVLDQLGHVPQEEDPASSVKPLEIFLASHH